MPDYTCHLCGERTGMMGHYKGEGKPFSCEPQPKPKPDWQLIVYRCYDTQEEEACFLMKNPDEAKEWLDENPSPPLGFRHRKGYYFFEPNSGPY